jgi:hypothetical protein
MRLMPGKLAATSLLMFCFVVAINVQSFRSSVLAPRGSVDCTQASAPMAASRVRRYLAGLKVLNYYPANNTMTNMWSHWNPAAMDQDFRRIASLHVNAVRVAVFTTFGFPQPQATMLKRLSQVLDLAARHGLRVQLTLFAFFQNYGDIAGSEQWARSVLAPYRNDRHIAFIDLHNELPVDDARALAWARALVPCARYFAGNIPVTTSVAGDVGIPGLQRIDAAAIPIDFYDLHYYGSAPLAYSVFQRALSVIGGAPLFIGETGYPSYSSSHTTSTPNDNVWWEAYQDQYHRTVQFAARALGLPAPAPWIYSDNPPGAIPPSQTAQNPAEYHYGLFRTNGTEKPVANSLRTIFGGGAFDTSFNNGFEAAGPSGMPTNWLLWKPSEATFARDTGVSHSGTASARISASAASGSDIPSFYLSPVMFIEPGQAYTASV